MALSLHAHGDGEDNVAYERDDLIRLLGQSLRTLGFESIADQLQRESRVSMESESVRTFRQAVEHGQWDEACAQLDKLQQTYVIDDRHVKFLMYKEQFLEHLEGGRVREALLCLRKELTPRSNDAALLHLLGQAVILPQSTDVRALLKWPGTGPNRIALIRSLEQGPCSRWLLPHHRLDNLLRQALQAQRAACLYHNTRLPVMSLLYDHQCQQSVIPHKLTATLSRHSDEVWVVRFSHDGRSLATCSKDGRCIIWDIASCTPRHVLCGHVAEVEFCDWSPDDKVLLTCGGRSDRLVIVWDAVTGACMQRLLSHEKAVTAVAWTADGKTFVSASEDQKINFWDAKTYKVVHTWTPVRATSLAITRSGRLVVVCHEHKLHLFDIEKREVIFCQPESGSVTSVCVSRDGREALVGLLKGEVHLWSIEGEVAMLRRFMGHVNGHYVLRACFGGAGEDFVVCGSEDGQIYIWHRATAKLLLRIDGHPGCVVNAVAWCPSDFSLLASAGDDHTVRIWGVEERGGLGNGAGAAESQYQHKGESGGEEEEEGERGGGGGDGGFGSDGSAEDEEEEEDDDDEDGEDGEGGELYEGEVGDGVEEEEEEEEENGDNGGTEGASGEGATGFAGGDWLESGATRKRVRSP